MDEAAWRRISCKLARSFLDRLLGGRAELGYGLGKRLRGELEIQRQRTHRRHHGRLPDEDGRARRVVAAVGLDGHQATDGADALVVVNTSSR